MAEHLDPHVQDVMDENQDLQDQQRVAAERVREAEEMHTQGQRQLDAAQAQSPRSESTPAIRDAEWKVDHAEELVDGEKQRQEDHRRMTAMATSENLDVLTDQAKKEMDADLASRDSSEDPDTAKQ